MLQDDPLARFFYETECIKGTWSVRELRRQISTNLYFRSGASQDPKKLLASIKPETNTPSLTIRQPFTFVAQRGLAPLCPFALLLHDLIYQYYYICSIHLTIAVKVVYARLYIDEADGIAFRIT